MRRVAIAASSKMAAEAAVRVSDAGGNAVDAAIASTIVAMTTEPGIIGPGAGTFLTIWPPDGDPVVIDAYAEMPGRGLPATDDFGERIWMAYGGGMESLVGHASVAIPGAFTGLGRASERFGALPWAEVVRPAEDICREGFPYSPVSASYLAYAHEPIFDKHPESYRAVHHPDGRPLGAGDTVIIEHLADSLATIGAEGPDSMLTGSIGARLAADMRANGGRITAEDLAAYEAIERQPLRVAIDDWEVATNPVPAVGGAALVAMLMLLDDHSLSEWSAEEVAQLATIQRAVLGYRARSLDPLKDKAPAVAALLDSASRGDLQGIMASPSTVHQSSVDTDGLACAVTTSAGYGSGVMIPETGLWLNNSLGEIDLHPHGLGDLVPGDRLPSNMAPTIARRSDGAVLAVGSPGASRITTALAQVLINFIHIGMSLSDAVGHPRIHAEMFEGKPTLAYEPGMDVSAIEGLTERRFPDLSMYFGGVGATLYDPFGGMFKAADPRRTGHVAVGGH